MGGGGVEKLFKENGIRKKSAHAFSYNSESVKPSTSEGASSRLGTERAKLNPQ